MQTFIASVVGAAIVSTVITKILATRYFKLADTHVNEMCDMTKKFIDDAAAVKVDGEELAKAIQKSIRDEYTRYLRLNR